MRPLSIRKKRVRRSVSDNKSGSVAIIFAVYMPIALCCLGLVIDLMMVHIERRNAQGVVDVSAIMAAEFLTNQEGVARNILELNGLDTISQVELGKLEEEEAEEKVKTHAQVHVEAGRYEPDLEKSYADRFVVGATPYNAARVTMSKKSRYYFMKNVFDSPQLEVQATAARQELAAFSVGSRLASLNGGLVNDVLGELIGTDISLSVLDYNALLSSDIELFDFLDALATRMSITSGDYDNVLASDPTLKDVLQAMIDVGGAGPGATALTGVLSALHGPADTIDLRRVMDLGPAGDIELGAADAKGFPAMVSMFDLLFANAVVLNGENLITLDLSASVPSLAAVTATVEIGEPLQSSPWLSIGRYGETVSNTQARIYLEAAVGGSGLLSSIEVRLPLYIEVARAEGELKSVNCPGGVIEDTVVTLEGASSLADMWVGDVDMKSKRQSDDYVKKAKIVSAPGLVAFADAYVGTAPEPGEALEFTWSDIQNGVVKSTKTDHAVDKLVASLFSELDIEAKVLGLGLSSEVLAKAALRSTLENIAEPVGGVVDELLSMLGVKLGEGDYLVNGVKCNRAVLVE